MQYKFSTRAANLVQVHPDYADIVSNGEFILSYHKRSNKLQDETRRKLMPIHYQEFNQLENNE
jgi:hypothetical protein